MRLQTILRCFFVLSLTSLNAASAQTVLTVPFDKASFTWTAPLPGPTNSPATKHTIVCGALSVEVPMPATSIPVRNVVPGVGAYTCSLFASNAFGRQVEADVPFPPFEAGLIPPAPTGLRLEITP